MVVASTKPASSSSTSILSTTLVLSMIATVIASMYLARILNGEAPCDGCGPLPLHVQEIMEEIDINAVGPPLVNDNNKGVDNYLEIYPSGSPNGVVNSVEEASMPTVGPDTEKRTATRLPQSSSSPTSGPNQVLDTNSPPRIPTLCDSR